MRLTSVDLKAGAIAEAARLSRSRAVANLSTGDERRARDFDRPRIARARAGDLRRALAGRHLLIWRVAYEDAGGRVVESCLVSMLVRTAARPGGVRHHAWIRNLLRGVESPLRRVVDEAAPSWRTAVVDVHERFASVRTARELAIAAYSPRERLHMFQPGLFDRRGERGRQSEDTAADEADGRARARVDAAANAGHVTSRQGELLLVLTP